MLRLLDELDATTAHIGEIETAIEIATANDDNTRRQDAMMRAVSLKARAETVKSLEPCPFRLAHRHRIQLR